MHIIESKKQTVFFAQAVILYVENFKETTTKTCEQLLQNHQILGKYTRVNCFEKQKFEIKNTMLLYQHKNKKQILKCKSNKILCYLYAETIMKEIKEDVNRDRCFGFQNWKIQY